jgi:hypothetical protein
MKMKKAWYFLFLLPIFVWAATGTYTLVVPSTVPVGTTDLPLTSTNTFDTSYAFEGGGRSGVRIAMSFTSTAANTNGTVTVIFSTSVDGVNYDTAAQSGMQLSASVNGTNQVVKSDWFQMTGVRDLYVSRIVDSSGAAVTNLLVKIGTPTQ